MKCVDRNQEKVRVKKTALPTCVEVNSPFPQFTLCVNLYNRFPWAFSHPENQNDNCIQFIGLSTDRTTI